MDDAEVVQVLDRMDNLPHQLLHAVFRHHKTPLLDVIEHVLACYVLKHHKIVVLVFKDVD
jgi:hypothetical protein